MISRLVAVTIAVLAVGFASRTAATTNPTAHRMPSGDVTATRALTADDRRSGTHPAAVRLRPSGDGFLVVTGRHEPRGSGRTVHYTVEVTSGLVGRAAELAATTRQALSDESRGWAQEARLHQVDNPDRAAIRIVLAEPERVDQLCALAGFATGGQLSCWNGRFAALNVMRWRKGAAGFDSLEQYRLYQINHEFGHGLGYGHQYCAGPGAPAPLMMQQTKGLLGCRANPWPHG